tara:strand:+ start:2139 stop:2510 length:372 start_codon:yes stop_codon:yes gene_type:complete
MSLFEWLFGECKSCAALREEIGYLRVQNTEQSQELKSAHQQEREFISRVFRVPLEGVQSSPPNMQSVNPRKTRSQIRHKLELRERKSLNIVTERERKEAAARLEAEDAEVQKERQDKDLQSAS